MHVHVNVLVHRAQIGETTDTLNRLEGDLTIVQDSNSEASKELSALEREARELNLTSEQLHHQLDVLKNSNFLGEREKSNKKTDLQLVALVSSTVLFSGSFSQESPFLFPQTPLRCSGQVVR